MNDSVLGSWDERYNRAHEAGDTAKLEELERELEASFEEALRDAENDPVLRLKNDAIDCELRGDWAGAESRLRQALSLSNDTTFCQWMLHGALARVTSIQGRRAVAHEHAAQATQIAREDDSIGTLTMSIQAEASLLIKDGDAEGARCLIDEAMVAWRADPGYELYLAKILICRALCSLAEGNEASVEEDIDKAIAILKPLADPMAVGVLMPIAECWMTRAKLRARRNDHDAAVAAWEEALAVQRQIANEPHVDDLNCDTLIAPCLRRLAQSLQSAGREAEAKRTFAEYEVLCKRSNL